MSKKMREEMCEKIEREVKNTVGYNESEDKKEFLKGAQVGTHQALDIILPLLYSEKNSHKLSEEREDALLAELKTVSNIFTKYSDDD